MEAQLTVEEGPTGRTVASLQPGDSCVIGQGPGAQLVLRDPSLGGRHAAVKLEGERLWAVDLGCPGGTRINDAPLGRTPEEVFGGDALSLGAHRVRLTLLGRGRATRRRPALPKDDVVPAEEFQLLRVLGSGAAGRVYAARWMSRGLDVAIKVLHEEARPGSDDYERFRREASTVARLQSPFVVAVYDLRDVEDRAFVVMELVEGPSAREVLTRSQGQLPVHHALRIGEDVAQALAAAAEVGVVHRDVKPANIVLSPQGVAKLCDFGIAKDMESTMRSLTTSGMGLGTMAYMPPEQLSEAKYVEPSADVYSLGATLYHLLAGRPPFNPSSAASLALILDAPPPALVEWRPDCPWPVAQLVHAMLSKEPDDRPPLWKLKGELEALRVAHFLGQGFEGLFGP